MYDGVISYEQIVCVQSGRYWSASDLLAEGNRCLHHQFELIGNAQLMAQVAVFATVILYSALMESSG